MGYEVIGLIWRGSIMSPPNEKDTIEERVRKTEIGINTLSTQIKMFFAAGIIFWGLAQTVIGYKLYQIDNAIKQIAEHNGRLNLLEYRQGRQDDYNLLQTQKIEEIDRNFRLLESRLNRRSISSD